jgi:hypothetical protein
MQPHPGMHCYLLSESTPENFEQPPATTIARQGRKAKPGLMAEEPQENKKFRAAIVEPGMVPLVKTGARHLSAYDLYMKRLRPDFPQPASRRHPSPVNAEQKSAKKPGTFTETLQVADFPNLLYTESVFATSITYLWPIQAHRRYALRFSPK